MFCKVLKYEENKLREMSRRSLDESQKKVSLKIQLIGVHIATASRLATLSFRLFAIPEKIPQTQG